MEHFDHTNEKSIAGSLLTISLAIISHITKEDVLVYVSIVAGLITIGYTTHKWLLIKKQK